MTYVPAPPSPSKLTLVGHVCIKGDWYPLYRDSYGEAWVRNPDIGRTYPWII